MKENLKNYKLTWNQIDRASTHNKFDFYFVCLPLEFFYLEITKHCVRKSEVEEEKKLFNLNFPLEIWVYL
jgi:hypothetical protein